MDTRIELSKVRDELKDLNTQLEHLLERQGQLLLKEKQLQRVLKEEAATANDDAENKWNKTDFSWSKELEEKRNSVFDIHSYRPLQLQTMNTTLSGKDCILVMPTGGGKSLCFQLPALVSKGVTLVVSPLVSLMEDQLFSLDKIGVAARLLNASSTKEHVNWVHNAMANKSADLKLLYVTPEKLAKSKRFMNKLEKMYEVGRFSRLVIDEIHCCSQWGHDFRPDYKFLGIMKKQFPTVPILGLTATATSGVLSDVKKILAIQDCVQFKASFNRHNLYYEVKPKPSNFKACMDDIQKLINTRFKGQSGIVYCFSQKDTEEVARELTARNIRSACYHGNLNSDYRSKVHSDWISDKVQVVVATIAFGMGIDKPDVRFVIHHSLSKSMENYYQESGRAGRDDCQSSCILYAGFQDLFRQSTMVFTEQTGQEKLYNMIAYAFDTTSCRRTLIAKHFGEKWDISDCNEMCDHCNPSQKANIVLKDVTKHCRDIISTIHKHAGKTRLTGLKLMESWLGKGCKNSMLPRPDAEKIIVHMILNGYLREDFHFTAYSTISYLVAGTREHHLNVSDHKVQLEFMKNIPKNSNNVQTATNGKESPKSCFSGKKSKTKASPGTSSKDKGKVPCIINENNSQVSDSIFVTGSQELDTQNDIENKKGTSKPKAKKRKKVVISDDSDSDFDFGDISPPKKNKGIQRLKDFEKHKQMVKDKDVVFVNGDDISTVAHLNGKGDNCIVLDDSDTNSLQ